MSTSFAEFSGHPVEQDDYVLATKPVIELELQIKEWVKHKVRGAVIYGRPRLGKTRAIRHLRGNIKQLFGKEIANFLLNCGEEDFGTSTDRSFFTDFLVDVNYGLPSAGNANDKRRRLIDFMMSEALRAGDRRIFLFIDEAQNLSSRQLGHIIHIFNILEDRGFRLYTFQYGQAQLLHRKSALRHANKDQMVARLMATEYQFHGIRDKEDVRYALSRYDDPSSSEYPEGSGQSYTEYFFPTAYAKGWRLSRLTDLIYDGFQQARSELQLDRTADIPMAPFTALVDVILTEQATDDETGPDITAETIATVLDNVKYEAYERALMRAAASELVAKR